MIDFVAYGVDKSLAFGLNMIEDKIQSSNLEFNTNSLILFLMSESYTKKEAEFIVSTFYKIIEILAAK